MDGLILINGIVRYQFCCQDLSRGYLVEKEIYYKKYIYIYTGEWFMYNLVLRFYTILGTGAVNVFIRVMVH